MEFKGLLPVTFQMSLESNGRTKKLQLNNEVKILQIHPEEKR